MKEYRGYFRSCDTSIDEKGQLFRVSIYTKFNNSTVSNPEYITLTDEPFVVEYEGENENYQKPYKCSTATVNFLYDTFNPDFSNTNNNNMLVVLSKWRNNNYYTGDELSGYWHYNYNTIRGNYTGQVSHTTINDELPSSAHCWETVWIGYGTPNTYNQGFEGFFDEVSINAQDALSTLNYVDYAPVDVKKGVVSFADIFKKYIKRLNAYRYIYVTDSLVAKTIDQQDILHALYVHEDNFFDENNKPMKVMEVIDHICNYLNITVIPYGDAIYFINYDGIKNGYNDYYVWMCDDNQDLSRQYLSNPTYTLYASGVTLAGTHDIQPDDFAENGTSLNVLTPYNKVTVKDDVYPIDTIAPALENDNKIVRQSIHDRVGTVYCGKPNDSYRITYSDNDMTKCECYGVIDTDKHILYLNFKNFNDETIKTYWYNADTYTSSPIDTLTPNETPVNNINTERLWNIEHTNNYSAGSLSGEYIGCCLIDYKDYMFDSDDAVNVNSIDTVQAIAFFQKIPDGYAARNSTQNYVTYDKNVWVGLQHPIQPMFEVSANDVILDKNTVIKIEGTFTFCESNITVPFNLENTVDKCSRETSWVWATLQVGDKYWAENLGWIDRGLDPIPPYFRLPLEYDANKNAFYTDYPIISSIRGYGKLSEAYNKYFTTPSPIDDDNTYVKDVKFTIYRTLSPRLEAYSPLALLKGFNISTKITKDVAQTKILTKDEGSDTEYTQTLNNSSVEDYPDISYKITTWGKKYPNNSSVLLQPRFYENGYNNVNQHTFARLYGIYYKGAGTYYMPEHLKIDDIQEQYSIPTICVSFNLKNNLDFKPWTTLTYHYFSGVKFIINSLSVDYKWNKITINTFEKE